MDSSLASISFTPINGHSSRLSINAKASIQPYSQLAIGEASYCGELKPTGGRHDHHLKRKQAILSDDSSSPVKRQIVWPVTIRSGPFQALKNAKCDSHTSTMLRSESSSGSYRSRQNTKTTMDQLAFNPTRMSLQVPTQLPSSSRVCLENDYTHKDDQASTRTAGIEPAIVGCQSILIGRGSNDEDSNMLSSSVVFEQGHTPIETNSRRISLDTEAKALRSPLKDEYPLDDLVDEDLTLLLDTAQGYTQEIHIPSPDISIPWDHDSRSSVHFDPNLQYSPPGSSSENCSMTNMEIIPESRTGKSMCAGEDLLDEEVDWHAVYTMISTAPKNPSLAGSRQLQIRSEVAPKIPTDWCDNVPYVIDDSMSLRPFSPKPTSRELSYLPKLKNNTVLRTCFRIGEMLSQTIRCHRLHEDIIFELFARVTYSNRERVSKRQHFQFIDLQKDQQPYPTGILMGWEADSHLDRQSLAFTNTKAYPKMCWCLCKPNKDPKAVIGWTYTIISIKEADWGQISLAKTIFSGGEGDSIKGALIARL